MSAGRPVSLVEPLGFGAAPPSTIAGAAVDVSYQPPSADRLDVVRPERSSDLGRNLLGGSQRASRVFSYGLCRYDIGSIFGEGTIRGCGTEPAAQSHALAELRVAWNRRGGRIVTAIPPAWGDLRRYRAISVRVVPDPSDRSRNGDGVPRPFSLALRDASGRVAAVAVARTDPAVQDPVRITVLGTVRIPLAAFGARRPLAHRRGGDPLRQDAKGPPPAYRPVLRPLERRAQRPRHSGRRFSTNAHIPSWASSASALAAIVAAATS